MESSISREDKKQMRLALGVFQFWSATPWGLSTCLGNGFLHRLHFLGLTTLKLLVVEFTFVHVAKHLVVTNPSLGLRRASTIVPHPPSDSICLSKPENQGMKTRIYHLGINNFCMDEGLVGWRGHHGTPIKSNSWSKSMYNKMEIHYFLYIEHSTI